SSTRSSSRTADFLQTPRFFRRGGFRRVSRAFRESAPATPSTSRAKEPTLISTRFFRPFLALSRFSTGLRIRLNVIDFFLFPEVPRSHGTHAPQGGFLE